MEGELTWNDGEGGEKGNGNDILLYQRENVTQWTLYGEKKFSVDNDRTENDCNSNSTSNIELYSGDMI